MSRSTLLLAITLLLSMLAGVSGALAQVAPGGSASTVEAVEDPFGRHTPRGTVRGYIAAVAADDLTLAARYLEVEDQSALAARKLARSLRIVLDRSGDLLPTTEIANVPEGRTSDTLEPDLDRIGAIGEGAARRDLHLRRVERGGTKLWLIEERALRAVPLLLERSREGLVERWTPTMLKGTSFGGAPAGDWAAIAVVAVLALLAGAAAAFGLGGVVRAVWRRSAESRDGRWLTRARMPVALALSVGWFKAGALALGVSIVARAAAGTVADIVFVVALAWFAAVAIDHLSRTVLARFMAKGEGAATSVVALARKIAKSLAFLAGAFFVLDIMGVDVTTGLAALGIGGLALALGAQKTVENLVGSVTLVADRPIRIGDFCRFEGVLGTVEDIGIRSTRVRTLERTIVTIPNGAFASMQIENFSKRERFLFRHDLSLRYETPAAQVRAMVADLHAMLLEHPLVDDTSKPRVVFKALGADNLTVEMFAYLRACDFAAFLAAQQEMLLDIMDLFETRGVGFAFPSQTLYLARDDAMPWEQGLSTGSRTPAPSMAPTTDDLREVVRQGQEGKEERAA